MAKTFNPSTEEVEASGFFGFVANLHSEFQINQDLNEILSPRAPQKFTSR